MAAVNANTMRAFAIAGLALVGAVSAGAAYAVAEKNRAPDDTINGADAEEKHLEARWSFNTRRERVENAPGYAAKNVTGVHDQDVILALKSGERTNAERMAPKLDPSARPSPPHSEGLPYLIRVTRQQTVDHIPKVVCENAGFAYANPHPDNEGSVEERCTFPGDPGVYRLTIVTDDWFIGIRYGGFFPLPSMGNTNHQEYSETFTVKA